MRFTGIVLIIALILIPFVWFLPLYSRYDPLALTSQYLGVVAIVAMGLSQLLSTRLPIVEPVFGPLDRVYGLHKWLGVAAVCAFLLHDAIGPEIDRLGRETALTELSEDFGEISYYGILVLGIISVATIIPYGLWRWTHKLMGVFFTLGVVHFVTALKPFANTDPLGLYVIAFGAIGLLSYIYDLLSGPLNLRWHRYNVSSAELEGGALYLSIKPKGKGIKHRPGQFAFLKFDTSGVNEPHPFTISSAPNSEGTLEFTIKPLGDFTHRISDAVQPGTGVFVQGPFGRFASKADVREEIWIAGGIGITPFLAMAQALPEKHQPVHLFYCVRHEDEAPHLQQLRAIASADPAFHLHLFASQNGQRLTAADVERLSDDPVSRSTVYYCGPRSLRIAMMSGLRQLGLKPGRFHCEEFELRTGIGLGQLFAKVLPKSMADIVEKLPALQNTSKS